MFSVVVLVPEPKTSGIASSSMPLGYPCPVTLKGILPVPRIVGKAFIKEFP